MAGTSLAMIEREFDRDHMPMLANILLQTPSVPAAAFRAGFMIALHDNPDLQNCTRISLFNCANTFGFAGVMPSKHTGQAFILPFRNSKSGLVDAVPVIGYKGYSTVAARSGIAIEGAAVRKDDDFKFTLGTKPNLHHEPNLEKSGSQIIGAWSLLVKGDHRFSPVVMGIKQLLAIKAKSAGARKKDSPWNDEVGPGFEAMCIKTPWRKQSRAIPLNAFMQLDAMEGLHDAGQAAWILPRPKDGAPAVITADGVQHAPKPEETVIDLPPKDLKIVVVTGEDKNKKPKLRECVDIDEWEYILNNMITKVPQYAEAIRKANSKYFYELSEAGFEVYVNRIIDRLNQAGGGKKKR